MPLEWRSQIRFAFGVVGSGGFYGAPSGSNGPRRPQHTLASPSDGSSSVRLSMTPARLLLGLLGAGAAVVWLARLFRGELAGLREHSGSQLAERNAEVDRRLGALVETMDRRLAQLDVKVD